MSDDSTSILPPRAPSAWLAQFCSDNAESILSMYSDECMSFAQIAARIQKELDGVWTITAQALRYAFVTDARLNAAYNAGMVDRAHTLVEQAVGHADDAAASGDHAQAARIKMAIAAKLAPQIYGDKVEVTGAGAGALQTATTGVPDHILEAIVAARAGKIPTLGAPPDLAKAH